MSVYNTVTTAITTLNALRARTILMAERASALQSQLAAQYALIVEETAAEDAVEAMLSSAVTAWPNAAQIAAAYARLDAAREARRAATQTSGRGIVNKTYHINGSSQATQLASIVSQAQSGDTIIVASAALRELAERACKRMSVQGINIVVAEPSNEPTCNV